jgi:hypothetical protein
MRITRLAFAAPLLLLSVAACSELASSNMHASTQQGPDRWYMPMQERADGCYVGPNATEPGSMPKACGNAAVAATENGTKTADAFATPSYRIYNSHIEWPADARRTFPRTHTAQ